MTRNCQPNVGALVMDANGALWTRYHDEGRCWWNNGRGWSDWPAIPKPVSVERQYWPA